MVSAFTVPNAADGFFEKEGLPNGFCLGRIRSVLGE